MVQLNKLDLAMVDNYLSHSYNRNICLWGINIDVFLSWVDNKQISYCPIIVYNGSTVWNRFVLYAHSIQYIYLSYHDDVIKWKHFPRYWSFVRGLHRSVVNSPHRYQWSGALTFSLICALNKRLSKQWWGWWFETPSRSLVRHCNGSVYFCIPIPSSTYTYRTGPFRKPYSLKIARLKHKQFAWTAQLLFAYIHTSICVYVNAFKFDLSKCMCLF